MTSPPPTTSTVATPAAFHDDILDGSRDLQLLDNWKTHTSYISTLGVQVLQAWELPRRDSRYYIGADVSDGINEDRSVISVVRGATDQRPFEEVAQYISPEISPVDFAYVIDTVGRFYCDADGLEAQAAVETNNHGLATHSELDRHLGYINFYIWQWEDSRPGAKRHTNKAGWVTSKRSRPLLITRLHQGLTSFDDVTGLPDLIINSSYTFDELRDFQTQGSIGEAEAAPGSTDDCVMALGIAYYTALQEYLEGGETIADRRRRLSWEAVRTQELTRRRGMARDFINTDSSASEMGGAGYEDDGFEQDLDDY